jgi:hypothetical protein
LRPGAPPTKTALLNANAAIQWARTIQRSLFRRTSNLALQAGKFCRLVLIGAFVGDWQRPQGGSPASADELYAHSLNWLLETLLRRKRCLNLSHLPNASLLICKGGESWRAIPRFRQRTVA